MCIYLLRPGAWTPNPRATNFTMLVEGFFFRHNNNAFRFFQIFVGVQKNFFFYLYSSFCLFGSLQCGMIIFTIFISIILEMLQTNKK